MTQIHLQDVSKDFGEDEVVIDRYPFVIGRNDRCHYQLKSSFVSRRHCSFCLWNGQVWVKDLESSNGTFLNGKRVIGAKQVLDGDQVGIGPFVYLASVHQESPEDAEMAAAHS